MHAYRQLIQGEMDARGWRPSELARRAGLGRQLISKILNDQRDHLGQMPDDSTMAGIATAFGMPEERVRQAAARSLVGYVDTGDGDPMDTYSVEYILDYVQRRVSKGELAARTSDEPKPE